MSPYAAVSVSVWGPAVFWDRASAEFARETATANGPDECKHNA